MYQINWIGNWHSQMNVRLFSLRGKRLHAVAQIVVRSPTANSRVYLSDGHTNAFEAGVIFCTFLPTQRTTPAITRARRNDRLYQDVLWRTLENQRR
jgi:hypothetical protein